MEWINKVLWAAATVFILGSGFYFTFHLRGIQFRFGKMFSCLFQKSDAKDSVSPFQSLMMVLAGRIGVGSIAGVALAIYLGGVGTIFWMWVTAFVAASDTFAETVLGVMYKVKDKGNIYRGGPAYYIKNGLGKPRLGALYAILILVSYIGGFLGIQANTITKSLGELTPVPGYVVGIVLAVLTALIIFGGIQKIVSATSKLVPIMTLLYTGIAVYILIANITLIPGILGSIVKDAFHLKPFIGGFLATLVIGIQRGIFSSEAGLGTGSIASSCGATNESAKQGYVQMLGIYITTLFICTATAIILLTSPYQELVLSDVNGIELTQFAFRFHLGNWGNILIFVAILLFSFSTILTGYYYGESSLKYFFEKIKSSYLVALKIATLVVVFLGSIASSTFLWGLVDLLVAILILINVYAIFALRKDVKKEVEYEFHTSS